jgi:hypothetical protein
VSRCMQRSGQPGAPPAITWSCAPKPFASRLEPTLSPFAHRWMLRLAETRDSFPEIENTTSVHAIANRRTHRSILTQPHATTPIYHRGTVLLADTSRGQRRGKCGSPWAVPQAASYHRQCRTANPLHPSAGRPPGYPNPDRRNRLCTCTCSGSEQNKHTTVTKTRNTVPR